MRGFESSKHVALPRFSKADTYQPETIQTVEDVGSVVILGKL